MDATATIVTGLATTVAAVLVAWLTARQSGRAANVASAVERARDLTERVERLEARIDELSARDVAQQQLLGQAWSFIDRMGMWLAEGLKGPKPRLPKAIRDFVDHTLWGGDDDSTPTRDRKPR